MKKVGILIIIVSLLFINLVSAEIRINEVELNPEGSDGGNEWIELYSSQEANLTGWKLINHDDKIKILNQSFNGFLIINFNEQWLDNENESVKLYNEDNLIHSTPILKDSFNDNRTWLYCNGNWRFLSSSKGYDNNCQIPSNNTNNQTNQTNPPNNTGNNSNSDISLEIDWDDNKIINGEDFKIEIRAFNLGNKKYDIKASIYDKNQIISQTYNEEDKWISSTEYFKEFFTGSGEQSEDIKMRIKEIYRSFKGDAIIKIRVRETGGSSYKKEIEEDIEILKSRDNEKISEDTNNAGSEKIIEGKIVGKKDIITTETIKLGNKEKSANENIKTNNEIVYQSKNESIKKYLIYFSAFLLIVFCILFVFIKT
jgi:hypothetical protein